LVKEIRVNVVPDRQLELRLDVGVLDEAFTDRSPQ
jgi:hypothetical protein